MRNSLDIIWSHPAAPLQFPGMKTLSSSFQSVGGVSLKTNKPTVAEKRVDVITACFVPFSITLNMSTCVRPLFNTKACLLLLFVLVLKEICTGFTCRTKQEVTFITHFTDRFEGFAGTYRTIQCPSSRTQLDPINITFWWYILLLCILFKNPFPFNHRINYKVLKALHALSSC